MSRVDRVRNRLHIAPNVDTCCMLAHNLVGCTLAHNVVDMALWQFNDRDKDFQDQKPMIVTP